MLKDISYKMNISSILLVCILVPCIKFLTAVEPPLMPNIGNIDKIRFKGKPVEPCRACRSLVKSFLQALEETNRQSFEGGDAYWEKHNLGSYESSELRFIEIQEKVCADVGLGKDQCYNLAEVHESELEEWFYEKRKEDVDLLEFLCINNLKICCPFNTYGPNCVPCPGGIESPCGGHGKCLNGGTRKEPAKCSCEAGYTGELCDQCEKGYYQEVDNSEFSCKICDRACKRHCRGPGPKNCEVCAYGYHFIPNEGCVANFESYKESVKMSSDVLNDTEDLESNKEPELGDTTVNNAQTTEHSEL